MPFQFGGGVTRSSSAVALYSPLTMVPANANVSASPSTSVTFVEIEGNTKVVSSSKVKFCGIPVTLGGSLTQSTLTLNVWPTVGEAPSVALIVAVPVPHQLGSAERLTKSLVGDWRKKISFRGRRINFAAVHGWRRPRPSGI